MTGARRFANAALLAAAIAVVLLLATAGDGGDESGGGDGTTGEVVAGLLLIFGPLISAGAVRSVSGSSLLRPVGSVVTAVGGLTTLFHVALFVESHGAAGWLTGAPALLSTALLIAAVVRGPEPRRRRPPATAEPTTSGPTSPRQGHPREPEGPPLDVLGPLAEARDHAVRIVLAWALALVALALLCVPVLRLLGWPEVTARLDARVVEVRPVAGRTAVTFQAERQGEGDGRGSQGVVHWTRFLTETSWEVGERDVVYLAEDGRVHQDQQFGLAGMPLLFPLLFVAGFLALGLRRLWGVAVAHWDAGHGSDAPRAGYAAVIDDPGRKSWRPLLAVWAEDPTEPGGRLPRPDAVYRVDDETAEDLLSPAAAVVVRRAWIDTGAWAGAKPRWVGFDDAVAVPHRRSLFGARYVRAITRKGRVDGPVDLHHGPPATERAFAPAPPPGRVGERRRGSRLPGPAMIVWRMLAALAAIALAWFVGADDGRRVAQGPAAVRRG